MFYVQNWDQNFSNHSAFQILKQQLSNVEKSFQYYNYSKAVKKDSYIQVEMSKIQKLVYIINDNLLALSANPNDKQINGFLFDGKIEDKTHLENELKHFKMLKKNMDSELENIQLKFDAAVSKIKEPQYKKFLKEVDNFEDEKDCVYGSRCGITALKVVDSFSKYINPSELKEVKSLEKLERMETSNVQVLNSFNKGALELKQQIVKDLRSDKHNLYFCVLDNGCFKDIGGWKHPSYDGHAFVIEKTKDDQFRIYQSYLNQYSLKSFLTSELEKKEEGLKSFKEFYPFLKNLVSLGNATQWDNSVNEAYKACFSVDHKAFLGEEIADGTFNLKYVAINILDEEFQESEVKTEIATKELETTYYDTLKMTAKSTALGVTIGTGVSAALYTSNYVLTNMFGMLF